MSVDLVYKLNGDVDEGINVHDLAPMLVALANLIDEAHRTLYPEDKAITASIKPFQKGSFEINISLAAKDAIQEFITFLASDPQGMKVVTTLTLLGFVQSTSGITLLQLIKDLKGRFKSVERLKSGMYTYLSEKGVPHVVSEKVHNLYQNCEVHNNFYAAVGKPLEVEGVTSTESYIKGAEEQKVIHNKEIVEPAKQYSADIQTCDDGDQKTENIRTIYVHPKRVSVEGESGNWSFRYGEKEIITASVHDENFLQKVKGGIIRLTANDLLLVEMVDRQTVKNSKIFVVHEVIKVLKYEESPEQHKLEL